MNESLLLLIYPVKTVSSLWQAAKSINYEILEEILVSNICHIQFIIYIREFTIWNILH